MRPPRFFRTLACIALALCAHPLGAAEYVCPNCPQMAKDVAALIPDSAVTVTAVASGAWSATGTWQGGAVPGTNAVVRIPEGISVTYDLDSGVELKGLRNEGTLTFATDRNTTLRVDTFLNQPTGTLTIGTATAPMPADKLCRIIFTDAVIDQGNDPKKLGKGLISNGVARIHGAPRLAHTSLAGDARKDDTSITLAEDPTGWRSGDTIVVGGVSDKVGGFDRADNEAGHRTNRIFEDEVLVITAINGRTISFTNVDITTGDANRLRYDHVRPASLAAAYGLKIPVANLSRTIRFESEVGATGSSWKRGHVMFMHAPTCTVKHAAFLNLGRTNKRQLLDDLTLAADTVVGSTSVMVRMPIAAMHTHKHESTGDRALLVIGDTVHQVQTEAKVTGRLETDTTQLSITPAITEIVKKGTVITCNAGNHGFDEHSVDSPVLRGAYPGGPNVRGRYPLHFHHMRLDQAVECEGNVVVGSPGWGLAHHFANVNLTANVVFDVYGCGIVAESGREYGDWKRNLVIKTTGNLNGNYNPNERNRTFRFDHGLEGDGFMVYGSAQSLLLEDNFAHSISGSGIIIQNNRSGSTREFGQFEVQYMRDRELRQKLTVLGSTIWDHKFVPYYSMTGLQVGNAQNGLWTAYNQTIQGLGWALGAAEDTEVPWSYSPPFFQRSRFTDFRFWNLSDEGISMAYAGRNEFVNGLIHGRTSKMRYGHYGNSSSKSLVFENIHFENCDTAIRVPGDAYSNVFDPAVRPSNPFVMSVLKGCSFKGINTMFTSFETNHTNVGYRYPDYIALVGNTFPAGSGTGPVARFSHAGIGGRSASFDATGSGSSSHSTIDIVAYGWDFDVDGVIDAWGRQATHRFPNTGAHTVRLTVWDDKARTGTVEHSIDAQDGAYANLIQHGAIPAGSIKTKHDHWDQYEQFSSAAAGFGWLARDDNGKNWSIINGAAVANPGYQSGNGIKTFGQIIRDNHIRHGEQTVSFRFKKQSGANGTAILRVWGVDGEFQFDKDGAKVIGLFESTRVKLAEVSMAVTSTAFADTSATYDVGSGYQYYLVQVDHGGTAVAIDDVSITGPGTGGGSNAAPTVASAAAASPATVTGTTTALSVLGADDDGEAALNYTWAKTAGPGSVSFSVNGSNAAKTSAATFAKAGSYTLLVNIADARGASANSSVTVVVQQSFTTLALTPTTATVASGATQQFTASAKDQFGDAMTATVSWTLGAGGLGTLGSSGLYTAPASGSGVATVNATMQGLSASASVTVSGSPGVLPPPWTSDDVGMVGVEGSASESGGTWSLTGSGLNIANRSDAFHFASRTLDGDGEIIARVASVQNSSAWSQAGIMLRAGTASGAAHAFVAVTPTRGVIVKQRSTAGAKTRSITGPTGGAPRWLRLVRAGDQITAATSADGTNWSTAAVLTVTLPDEALVGLAVTSRVDGTLCQAVFDNVAVTAAPAASN